MSKQFYSKQFSLAFVCSLNEVRSLNIKTALFQTIQFSISKLFSISTQFSSILPQNRILSGATTPGQSGPGSDG